MATDLTPAVDNPLTGDALQRLYDDQIKPELEKREVDRKAAMQTFRVIIGAGIALVVMESGLTHELTRSHSFIPDPRIWIVTLVGAVILAYLPLMGVAAKAKVGVIEAFCGPLGMTYSPKGEFSLFSTMQNLRLLRHPDDTTFDDHFAGVRANCAFELCEATLTKGSGKNRSLVFQGQLFRIAFPRKFLGVTVVLRDSGWLNHFECPSNLSKVGLEDPHFEKIFEVFGSDQVEARAILTPAFMQRFVDLESAYGGQHMRYAFTDGDLLIAIEAPSKFEIGGMFSTLVDRKRVESIAHDIGAVFQLIDSFVTA